MTSRLNPLSKKFSSRKKSDPDKHILPLINIVFLLLVFFMVAGRLNTSDPIALSPPKSVSNTQLEKTTTLVHVGGENLYFIGEMQFSKDRLLVELKALIQKTPDMKLRLKFDQAHGAKNMLGFLSELKSVGYDKVHLLTVKQDS